MKEEKYWSENYTPDGRQLLTYLLTKNVVQ